MVTMQLSDKEADEIRLRREMAGKTPLNFRFSRIDAKLIVQKLQESWEELQKTNPDCAMSNKLDYLMQTINRQLFEQGNVE